MPKIDDCASAFAGLPKVELHLHLDCSLNSAYARAYEPDLTLERFRAEFIAPVYAPDFAPYLRCANRAVALMQTTEALSGSIAESCANWRTKTLSTRRFDSHRIFT